MVPDNIPYLPSLIFLPFLCCIGGEYALQQQIEETACMVGSPLICGKPDE